ncbi:hypothetical protein H257_16117 [Aphanomyces astaci]|uniref:Uncharacterized protein n=1 Tax=Aphanomyces astaci TaxID=112090 RepID=W4FM30_APHAT|nr:hypothetical protein H257_16117 [Aphanomyces astaci]ETV67758.1 hypothetical protein H257_16117 [Aphanomyces astaci]|eukprot:XP_009842751.1 hypothetical protein H257_16117 [Aphanomyces astaci]
MGPPEHTPHRRSTSPEEVRQGKHGAGSMAQRCCTYVTPDGRGYQVYPPSLIAQSQLDGGLSAIRTTSCKSGTLADAWPRDQVDRDAIQAFLLTARTACTYVWERDGRCHCYMPPELAEAARIVHLQLARVTPPVAANAMAPTVGTQRVDPRSPGQDPHSPGIRLFCARFRVMLGGSLDLRSPPFPDEHGQGTSAQAIHAQHRPGNARPRPHADSPQQIMVPAPTASNSANPPPSLCETP